MRQSVRSTTEALEAFDGITYSKGAALLGMVERWIGPEVFRRGVSAYLAAHRFGSATGEDLFAALGKASAEDVSGVLRSFTEQTGVPSITMAECRTEGGAAKVRVTPAEYRPLGAGAPDGAKAWHLPVCLHYGDLKAGGTACAVTTGAPVDVTLPGPACPPFVYPNAEQAGYFRARLRPEDLTDLATLPLGALTDRERVGLYSDAWAA